MDRDSFWFKLDATARQMTPFLMTVMMVVITQIPLRLPGIAPVTLALALVSVYYWALHQPDLLPAPAVFFIGLLQDMLAGTPLGLGAFSLLLGYGIVVSQRRFFHGKSFLVVWWGFSMTAVAVGLLRWLMVSMLEGEIVLFAPTLAEFALTTTLYPVFGYLFVLIHRSLLREA
jgi:rod shape-determining protein MreD